MNDRKSIFRERARQKKSTLQLSLLNSIFANKLAKSNYQEIVVGTKVCLLVAEGMFNLLFIFKN